MGMWRSLHPFRSEDSRSAKGPHRRRGKIASRRALENRKARRSLFERFEERTMLNGGPELISILANSGDIIYSHNTLGQPTVLGAAPRELDLLFNQGAVIDPATLGGIQVVGGGADGTRNTAVDG